MTFAVTSSPLGTLQRRVPGAGPDLPSVLQNHPTQSTVPIDGWRSVLCGLPFLLVGIGIAFAALYGNPSSKHPPNWLIGLIGSFFFLAGAFLIIHGLRGAAREAAHDREATAQPSQPWLADYHWQREGFAFSAFNAMVSRFFSVVAWNALLIPFFWIGLNQRGMGRIFLLFASLFALAGLIFWARWLKTLADLIRYGNSFLSYDSFPFFLGSSLNARLRLHRHFEAIDELTLTFRCVQEKYVTTGSGRNRTTQVVCYELFKDVATFSRPQLAAASSDLPISFPIPQNQSTTRLCDSPPTYWEIEARGKAHGAGYEAYFLVPVYKSS